MNGGFLYRRAHSWRDESVSAVVSWVGGLAVVASPLIVVGICVGVIALAAGITLILVGVVSLILIGIHVRIEILPTVISLILIGVKSLVLIWMITLVLVRIETLIRIVSLISAIIHIFTHLFCQLSLNLAKGRFVIWFIIHVGRKLMPDNVYFFQRNVVSLGHFQKIGIQF